MEIFDQEIIINNIFRMAFILQMLINLNLIYKLLLTSFFRTLITIPIKNTLMFIRNMLFQKHLSFELLIAKVTFKDFTNVFGG